MKSYTEKKAVELLRLPCEGYMEYTMDGNEYECGYYPTCICEDCICNFESCHGHIDPRTGHSVSDKILDKMREIVSLPYRRMKDNPLSPSQFQSYLDELKYWVVPKYDGASNS